MSTDDDKDNADVESIRDTLRTLNHALEQFNRSVKRARGHGLQVHFHTPTPQEPVAVRVIKQRTPIVLFDSE